MGSVKMNLIELKLLNKGPVYTTSCEEDIERVLSGCRESKIDPNIFTYDKTIEYFVEFLKDVFGNKKLYNSTKYFRFLEDVYRRGLYGNSPCHTIEKFRKLLYEIIQDKKIKIPVVIMYTPRGFDAVHFDRNNRELIIKIKHKFKIISGKHRIAIAIYLKMKYIPAYIIEEKFRILSTYWGKFLEEAEPRYLEEIKSKYVGGSDYKYHSNINRKKQKIIYDAVIKINPKTLVDIGCNAGKISYPFIEKGIEVTGIDRTSKEDLKIPSNYKFLQLDITKDIYEKPADVILFLSVYHHIVFNMGLKEADKIFYNIFRYSRYLIFDSGNPEEKGIYREYWIKELQKYFKTEKELLDHFGLRYRIIGKWSSGYDKNNYRSIVIFDK